jgi:pimeloyl-ACP methyl ester carboxylesterase
VRGFGKSDRPSEKFSDAADLLALVHHLDLAKVTLVGVSNGGRIALDFTVEHPERVERLVLVATGVHGYETVPEEDKVWEEFEKKMKPQEGLVKEGKAREAVEMDVNAWAPAQSPFSREHIMSIALDNSHILNNHPGKLQVSPDPPAFKRLSEVQVPTLLIIGDRDVEGMRMIMERLHGMIAGSKKVVITGADHIVNASRPDEFNQALYDFLA